MLKYSQENDARGEWRQFIHDFLADNALAIGPGSANFSGVEVPCDTATVLDAWMANDSRTLEYYYQDDGIIRICAKDSGRQVAEAENRDESQACISIALALVDMP